MKCEHCKKRYATWDGLREHVARKHPMAPQLPATQPPVRVTIATKE